MADFKLNASIKAVSLRVRVFPTLLISNPASGLLPIASSGCSFIPLSMISMIYFREREYYDDVYE